jgi:LysM repeat protein
LINGYIEVVRVGHKVGANGDGQTSWLMLISFKALALAPVTALAFVLADFPVSASPLPTVDVALEPADIEKASLDSLINALPAPSSDKIWVTARHSISIEQLSYSLAQDPNLLAKINNVETTHTFNPGDWIVFPSRLSRQVRQIAQIDTSELRRTPPLQSLAPVEERAVVRFGDTVLKIAQRYGLTLQELLRLNPGLETSRLVVGTQIRLSESSPGRTRMVLGLKPTSSGGISWPDDPGFGSTSGGKSSIGLVGPLLVGPFKRNPSAFARFLNSQPRIWEDPSLRTYFYDLYSCYSYPADNSSTMPPGYRCDGGYVSYSDNLGSHRCRLDYVSWSWNKSQVFQALGCK